MSTLLACAIGVVGATVAMGSLWLATRGVPRVVRWLVCAFRGHDTYPLKRIGLDAFVVACVRCGWVYLKVREPNGTTYHRYRGQFDSFEDYAEELGEAEPRFVDRDSTNA